MTTETDNTLTLESASSAMEGLLSDDGDIVSGGDEGGRTPPGYEKDESSAGRDEKGRFTKQEQDLSEEDETFVEDDGHVDSEETEDGELDDTEDSEGSDAEEDDADAEDSIQTVNELADALELSPEEFEEQISMTFKAAGKEVTATLAEMKVGYQFQADYSRSKNELAEEKRTFESQRQTYEKQVNEQHQALAVQFNATEQLLMAELNTQEMADLKSHSPSEFLLKRDEVMQKVQQVQTARNQAAAQFNFQRQQQMQEVKTQQLGALKEKIPDWSDDHAETARATLADIGMSDAEISNIYDHRVVAAVIELAALRKKAAEFDAKTEQAKKTIKKVKKAPQMLKPGAKRPQNVRRSNVAKLKQRAKDTGKLDDAAKLLEQFI